MRYLLLEQRQNFYPKARISPPSLVKEGLGENGERMGLEGLRPVIFFWHSMGEYNLRHLEVV